MPKSILLTILFLCLSVPSVNAEVVPCHDYAPYMGHAATVYLPDNPYNSGFTDLTVKGRLAYALGHYQYEEVLQVFDLYDDLAPIARGQLSLASSEPNAAFANIDHFVLVAGSDFVVVDVDDPDAPVVATVVPQDSHVNDVLVRHRLAYLALASGELRVYNMNYPAAPVLVGGVATSGPALCLDFSDDKLLVGDGAGLSIYSLADPVTPALLGTVNISGGVFELSAEGTLAVGCGDHGLQAQVVDFSLPSAPVVVAEDFVSFVWSVLIRDGVAWIGRESPTGGIILDRWSLADPAVPERIGHDLCPGYPHAIVLALGNVYTANLCVYYDNCQIEGIQVWSGQEPRTPPAFGQLTPGGTTGDGGSVLRGDWLYLIGELSVTAVNLADPSAPYIAGQTGIYEYPSFGNGCALVGDHLFVRLWNLHENEYWWQVYGLDDPAHPMLLHDVDLQSQVSGHGDVLFSTGGPGTDVYVVVPPGLLIPLGSYWPGEAASAPLFADSGSRAAVLHQSASVRLVDLANPLDPVILGEIPGNFEEEARYPATWVGDLLACRVTLREQWPLTGRWELWNVADPSAPVLLHDEASPPNVYLHGLVLGDHHLYAGDSAKIGAWDISVPTAPVHLGDRSHDSWQNSLHLHAHPDVLVTTGIEARVINLSYQCFDVSGVIDSDPLPIPRLVLDAAPNPFNPRTTIRFELPHAAQATLTIYDLAGRRVRTLYAGLAEAGTHVVTWDGTDSAGFPSSSGVYFCRLVADGESRSRKLLLLE